MTLLKKSNLIGVPRIAKREIALYRWEYTAGVYTWGEAWAVCPHGEWLYEALKQENPPGWKDAIRAAKARYGSANARISVSLHAANRRALEELWKDNDPGDPAAGRAYDRTTDAALAEYARASAAADKEYADAIRAAFPDGCPIGGGTNDA